jgi:hypothetical protein
VPSPVPGTSFDLFLAGPCLAVSSTPLHAVITSEEQGRVVILASEASDDASLPDESSRSRASRRQCLEMAWY